MTGRRDVLRAAGAVAMAQALGGCDAIASHLSHALGGDIPDHVDRPRAASVDPARHLLDRAAFGPWPGDVERVRSMGEAGWLDEQLTPARIDDAACRVRTARIDTVGVSPRAAFEWRPEVLERQLVTYTLLEAVYSKRQLEQVMVHFWTDHFNVAIGKSSCRSLKTIDDREVVRRHALGSFRELLGASARSPAMLVYLDGRASDGGPGARPNENYARELLELHTLGVDGGYTQRDVMEAARCLTGWVVRDERALVGLGRAEPAPERHDDGEKTVLGVTIPAGGGAERDLDRLLDVLVAHASCARFVATKLCRHFIADDPPRSAVDAAAAVFAHTGGSIAPVVRSILDSDDFRASAGAKLKRPFRLVVSMLRALGADTHAREGLAEALAAMGHAPFQHPTPEGYPDRAAPWLGTLLFRWNLATALVEGRLPGVSVDLPRLAAALGEPGADPIARARTLGAHLLGRSLDADEERVVRTYLASPSGRERPERAVALILSSPGYQWS